MADEFWNAIMHILTSVSGRSHPTITWLVQGTCEEVRGDHCSAIFSIPNEVNSFVGKRRYEVLPVCVVVITKDEAFLFKSDAVAQSSNISEGIITSQQDSASIS